MSRSMSYANFQCLEYLNESFHQEHHNASLYLLDQIPTVLIYKEGILFLWERIGDTYREKKYQQIVGREYTLLKDVAHIPALILTTIHPYLFGIKQYSDYLNDLATILSHLRSLSNSAAIFPDSDQDSQLIMITKSIKLIEFLSITANQDQVGTSVKCYMQDIQPHLEHNKKSATELQLKSLHYSIRNWSGNDNLQLEKSRVLIVGLHGSRQRMIEMQYFVKLYQDLGFRDVEDDMLYYVEVLPSHIEKIDILNDLIINFLGGAEVNKLIGQTILGTSKGMFSDVLYNHAPTVLDELRLDSANFVNKR